MGLATPGFEFIASHLSGGKLFASWWGVQILSRLGTQT